MAKQPKPLITVPQLEEATRAVAGLDAVRNRIARFQALVGLSDNTAITVHAVAGADSMTLVVPVDLLLSDLEDEEAGLTSTLRRLGVAIPPPVPAQPALAPAVPEAAHAE
jgi:hypothetical protein